MKTCIYIAVLYEKRGGGLTIIIKGGGGEEKEIKEKKRTDTKQQQPSKIKNKIWTRYRGNFEGEKETKDGLIMLVGSFV